MILLRHLLQENDRAYKGMAVSGSPLITLVGDRRAFKGSAISGAPLYTVVGNKLYKGIF